MISSIDGIATVDSPMTTDLPMAIDLVTWGDDPLFLSATKSLSAASKMPLTFYIASIQF